MQDILDEVEADSDAPVPPPASLGTDTAPVTAGRRELDSLLHQADILAAPLSRAPSQDAEPHVSDAASRRAELDSLLRQADSLAHVPPPAATSPPTSDRVPERVAGEGTGGTPHIERVETAPAASHASSTMRTLALASPVHGPSTLCELAVAHTAALRASYEQAALMSAHGGGNGVIATADTNALSGSGGGLLRVEALEGMASQLSVQHERGRPVSRLHQP
jgi:hypothetical protein